MGPRLRFAARVMSGALIALAGCAHLPVSAPAVTSDSGNSSGDSGNSSGQSSGNSGASSGQSSGGSGESSAGSGASSGQSSDSSNASGESSAQSSGSTGNESTEQSSANSTRSSTDGTSESSGGENAGTVLVPVSGTSTLAATTGGIALLIWSVNRPTPEAEAAAHLYLKSVRHRLEEELALGAGPTLEDLAALAQIRQENLPRFFRLLLAHRRELLALTDARTLTPARAGRALQQVGAWAAADPVLAEDGRRAKERFAEAQ